MSGGTSVSSTSLQLCMLTTEPLLEVQFGITSVLKNTAATNGRGFAVYRRSTELFGHYPHPLLYHHSPLPRLLEQTPNTSRRKGSELPRQEREAETSSGFPGGPLWCPRGPWECYTKRQKSPIKLEGCLQAHTPLNRNCTLAGAHGGYREAANSLSTTLMHEEKGGATVPSVGP